MLNDLPFITREVPSRRLRQVEPIDYVDAAPVTPSQDVVFLAKPIKRIEFQIFLQPNHLSVFKTTSPAYYTGWGQAFHRAVQVRPSRFNTRFRDVLHPIITDAVTATTPATYPSNDFVASIRRKETERYLLQTEPLRYFAPTISPAVYPAYLEPQAYRFRQNIRQQFVAELNDYPETAPEHVNYRIRLHAESAKIQLKSESIVLELSMHSCRSEPVVEQGDAVANLILPDGADILREDGGVILWQ